MRFGKITIVGVGLLGGSLGLAIQQRRLAKLVCGYARRPATIQQCKRLGAMDQVTTDLLAAVSAADLVILCTPLAQMRALGEQMVPALKRGAIVTDVGSVKGRVVKELEPLVASAGAHFVGSHPMAGAEKTGVLAAKANLFECAMCVVTPTRRTSKAALRTAEQFWKALGCRLLRVPPDTHDLLVSRTSHLPHVIAATLASVILDPEQPEHQAALCANGFRDTTRIASGSPEMWRDIAMSNSKHLDRALDRLVLALRKFREALKRGDADAITQFFETAKRRRDNWSAGCVSPSLE